MSKIIHESLYFFKSSKIVSFLIIGVVAISCFLSTFSYSLYVEIENDVIDFTEKNIETQYYRLGDNFVGEYEKSFKTIENYIAKLKSFYSELNNSNEFEYYELHSNSVGLINHLPDNKFLQTYSSGDSELSIIEVDDSLTVYQVNGMYVGENVFEDFDLSVESGNIFSTEDYAVENALNTKIVPVMLGNDYKDYYNIGDEIQASVFPVDEVKIKVIGFLNKDSYVNTGNGKITLLDRFIILPSFNFNSYNTSPEYTGLYRSLYYTKTDGVIASTYDANVIQNVINKICDNLEIFPYYYVIGATNQPSYILGLDMESMLEILKAITLFIFTFSFIIVTVFTLITIKRNLKYYSILSVNGFTKKDIGKLILLQPLYIFLCAFLLSFIIHGMFSGILRIHTALEGHLIMFLLLILLSLIIGLLGVNSLNKYDISTFLRKR